MEQIKIPWIIIGNRKIIKRLLKQIQLLEDYTQELKDKNEELAKKLHSRRTHRPRKKS